MNYDFFLRIIEISVQVIMVGVAWKALSVWKAEICGRDRYRFSKDLLDYIKKIRFLVYKKDSLHQIYLNDILVNRSDFYSGQLILIAKEKVCFDRSIMCLFEQINIRSDIFLPKKIRLILEKLAIVCLTKFKDDKTEYTYIQVGDVDSDKTKELDDVLYISKSIENMTIEEYFKNWEKLIMELKKNIYE
jgi:hypothetical protein